MIIKIPKHMSNYLVLVVSHLEKSQRWESLYLKRKVTIFSFDPYTRYFWIGHSFQKKDSEVHQLINELAK